MALVGLCEAPRGVITSSGMHRQVIHLGLFLAYLQLLYIKTWVVLFFFFLMSISFPVLGCHSYFHSNLLREKKKLDSRLFFLLFLSPLILHFFSKI